MGTNLRINSPMIEIGLNQSMYLLIFQIFDSNVQWEIFDQNEC